MSIKIGTLVSEIIMFACANAILNARQSQYYKLASLEMQNQAASWETLLMAFNEKTKTLASLFIRDSYLFAAYI